MKPRAASVSASVSAWLGWLAGVLIVASSASAHAAATCSILNTSGVAFGAYDTFSTMPVDSTGLVSFRCTGVAQGDMLSIELGRGGTGTFLPRAMIYGRWRLEYNLFLDAARTVVWGDGTSGTSVYSVHTVEGQSVSVPIFGRALPRQNVAPGVYNDLIVLTMNY
jgi:spore coat protein U-like protein